LICQRLMAEKNDPESEVAAADFCPPENELEDPAEIWVGDH